MRAPSIDVIDTESSGPQNTSCGLALCRLRTQSALRLRQFYSRRCGGDGSLLAQQFYVVWSASHILSKQHYLQQLDVIFEAFLWQLTFSCTTTVLCSALFHYETPVEHEEHLQLHGGLLWRKAPPGRLQQ